MWKDKPEQLSTKGKRTERSRFLKKSALPSKVAAKKKIKKKTNKEVFNETRLSKKRIDF